METTIVYCGYIRTMENKMEVFWGNMEIMEKNMETTRCVGHTRPWYGKGTERLRCVEECSRRVTFGIKAI